MVDVIIVGAGYGGMSTAALLAHSGLSVLIIEKSSLIGGRASSYRDVGYSTGLTHSGREPSSLQRTLRCRVSMSLS